MHLDCSPGPFYVVYLAVRNCGNRPKDVTGKGALVRAGMPSTFSLFAGRAKLSLSHILAPLPHPTIEKTHRIRVVSKSEVVGVGIRLKMRIVSERLNRRTDEHQ